MKIRGVKSSRTTLFFAWLLSYLFVLLIPIFIGIFVYVQAITIIRSEVNSSHLASLTQLKNYVDQRMDDVKRVFVQLTVNKELNSIMYYKKSMKPYQRITIIELQKELEQFAITNNYIDHIFIYFQKSDFILSDSGSFSSNEISFVNKKDFGFNEGNWRKYLTSNHKMEFRAVKIRTTGGIDKNEIVFQVTFPGMDNNSSKANLIIIMNQDKLNQSFERIKWLQREEVFAIDKNNNRLFSVDNKISSVLTYDDINKAQSVFYKTIGSDRTAISHSDSEVSNLKYVSIVPESIFLEKVRYVTITIKIYILLCIFVGGVIAYYFAKRNYNPIVRLMGMFDDNSQDIKDTHGNEMMYIEKSLLRLIDKNKRMEGRLNLQDEAVKNNFFTGLLKGRVADENAITNFLNQYKLKLNSGNFLIILLYFDKLSDLANESKIITNEKNLDLIYFAVKNITEELINEKSIGYCIEIDGMIAGIVSLKDFDNDRLNAEIESIFSKIEAIFIKYFKISPYIAVSNVHGNFSEFAEAYREVMNVAEYKKLMLDDELKYYKDICPSENNHLNVGSSLDTEQQFINCIKSEEYDKAIPYLNKIIDENIYKGIYSLQIIKIKMFSVVNAVMNTIGEIKNTEDIEFIDTLNTISRLLEVENIQDLKKEMNEIFSQIQAYYREKNSKISSNRIEEIVQYVEKNFADCELSIKSVADHFNMNSSYLSRMFKKNLGIGFLDFTHKLRIAEAKRLMKEKDITLKETAERVGYYNDIALIRAFKRYEGITPGKFKVIN